LLVEAQVMDYSLLVGVVDMASNGLFEFSKQRSSGKKIEHPRETKVTRRDTTTLREKKAKEFLLRWVAAPVRLAFSPTLFCARRLSTLVQWTVSSVVTMPMPYYGSGRCGVDGGALSVLHGTRHGQRAVYYMGLIDFLQPWTTRKVLERELKGLMGYDRKEISCVTPEEYASRFLEFIDAHVT
jgi:Phosphatidylinositol-4-phosphate 5-Kinase